MVYRSPVIQNPLDACFAIPFFAETRTLMRLCLLSGSVHSFVILRFREISRDNRRLHEEEYAPTFYMVNHVAARTSAPPAAPQATPIPKPAPNKKTTGRSAVTIYTDGACKGNPGPGGWAAIMIVGNHAKELSSGERETTNNRMELLGAINALSSLKYPCSVTLHSDSKYLTDAFNKGWSKGWQKNNWRTASKSPVKNVELWKQMIELTKVHDVTFVWVKGHDGNPYNNRCDELAVAEAEKFR